MKKIYSLILLVFTSVTLLFAQVPEAFNYQAVVRNSSGEIIADTNVAFRISILQGGESGPTIYAETHSATTNNFGLVNLQIGKGTVVSGVFMPSGWGVATHYIKVEIDPNGGNSFTHLGTSLLLSVPYAFHAQTVEEDKVDDADADPNNEIQTLSISGNDLSISDGNAVTLPASPWESSGNDIFFNSGKVGIATTLPKHNITINGKDGSSTQLCLQNNSSGGEINDGLLLGINISNNASYLWNYENAVMAFGTNNTQRMLISADGKVAIGEFLIPTASLHVNGNDGVLFEGKYGSGTIPKEGQGGRMMWYPKKAAFRTGYVNGEQWNDSNIGLYSVAMGMDTEASGEKSTAMGEFCVASGYASTAMGWNTTANSLSSTAIGYASKAMGSYSTAMGWHTTANSLSSTAIGYQNIGRGDPNTWVATDPIFEIGNGYLVKSNALTVLKNGNVGIGTDSPVEKLHIQNGYIQLDRGSGLKLLNTNSFSEISCADDDLFITSNSGGDINFVTSVGVDYSPRNRMIIKNDGNVGVGTYIPTEKLHVYGANPRILIEASSSNPEINFKNDGDVATSVWSIYKNGITGDLHFYQNGNKITFQKNTGNVGVGTTTPQGKLDVNGTIFQRGGILHADYVFEENYQLESIQEHTEFMWENKHLPAIPKATVDENGFEIVEVGSHRKGIVEELEKAHIYISQLEKAIDGLKLENENLSTKVNNQETRLEEQDSKLEQLESLIKAIASK